MLAQLMEKFVDPRNNNNMGNIILLLSNTSNSILNYSLMPSIYIYTPFLSHSSGC